MLFWARNSIPDGRRPWRHVPGTAAEGDKQALISIVLQTLWEHDDRKILDSLMDFAEADTCIDPICLNGYEWDDIKIAIVDECVGLMK